MQKPLNFYEFIEHFYTKQKRNMDCLLTRLHFIRSSLSTPSHPLQELDSFLPIIATLSTTNYVGRWDADLISTKSTLVFLKTGIVKHTVMEWKDSRIVEEKEKWYDQETSKAIYSKFKSMHFENWEKNYSKNKDVIDGGSWSLSISFANKKQITSKGQIDYPPNWNDALDLFKLNT